MALRRILVYPFYAVVWTVFWAVWLIYTALIHSLSGMLRLSGKPNAAGSLLRRYT
jgi:hypothetical protein